MRKILIVAALLASVCGTVQVHAVQGNEASLVKMSDLLRTMPDTLVPYLSENNRLDMIDFKEARMKAEVRNAQEGRSELVTLTDRYADMSLNVAHRQQIRLLDVIPAVDSCQYVICMVDTYGTDARESTVRFFSLTWRPLDASWFVNLPSQVFTAELSEQSEDLTLTLSSYYDRPATEEQQIERIFPIKLKWNQNFFK